MWQLDLVPLPGRSNIRRLQNLGLHLFEEDTAQIGEVALYLFGEQLRCDRAALRAANLAVGVDGVRDVGTRFQAEILADDVLAAVEQEVADDVENLDSHLLSEGHPLRFETVVAGGHFHDVNDETIAFQCGSFPESTVLKRVAA